MKTLELANIINFINDIREEKTFLIKGFFKESKTPLIKKEKYIFDNIDEEVSHMSCLRIFLMFDNIIEKICIFAKY